MQGRRGRATPRRGLGITDTPAAGPAAILVAGGLGQRASGSPRRVAKQFRKLGGKRVFEWSLDTLLSFGCDPVVCVFPQERVESPESTARRDRVLTTGGGSSRQASVAAGLELVDTLTVIVHDAARPFVTEAMLTAVMAPLSELDGAITALRMNETIKRADDGLVIETVDRSELWRSQTPQAFRTEALKQAHLKARDESFSGTDDAQLIERYGGRIALVPGDPSNIKLTYEEDFVVAKAMIDRLEGSAG